MCLLIKYINIQVVLHYPHAGFVEIDPDELWTSVVSVVHKSLKGTYFLNLFNLLFLLGNDNELYIYSINMLS